MDIVFGKKWFEKYQKRLLFLLNNSLTKYWFRWVLRIECLDTINRITPSSYSFGAKYIKQDIIEITTDFRTHDKYAKRLYYAFKYFWYILHAFDWALLDRVEALTKLSFGFSTLTAFPVAGANSPTDGHVVNDGIATFSAWRTNAAGTSISVTGTTADVACDFNGSTYDGKRVFASFDTSAIEDVAVISAAVLSFYSAGHGDGMGNNQAAVIVGTPAGTNTLVTGDWDAMTVNSPTELASRIAFASIADSTYNNFSLNASGIANVNLTGVCTFVSREGKHDIDNSAPNVSGNYIQWSSADVAGTSQDPKLVVTYTVNYTLSATVAAFALTGIAVNFAYGRTLFAAVTSYIVTGLGAIIRSSNKFTNQSKNSASAINTSKHSSTFINQSKS